MQPEYDAYPIILDPADVGHAGLSCRRMYIYFRHKDDCEYLWDLFEAHDAMAHSIADVVATSPSDYRVSTPLSRGLERLELSRKRKWGSSDPATQLNAARGLLGFR